MYLSFQDLSSLIYKWGVAQMFSENSPDLNILWFCRKFQACLKAQHAHSKETDKSNVITASLALSKHCECLLFARKRQRPPEIDKQAIALTTTKSPESLSDAKSTSPTKLNCFIQSLSCGTEEKGGGGNEKRILTQPVWSRASCPVALQTPDFVLRWRDSVLNQEV